MKIATPAKTCSYVKTLRGLYRYDSRISLGVCYFTDERDAKEADAAVRKLGLTYNGGWFDGQPCGRERGRDYTDENGVKWFAVTD